MDTSSTVLFCLGLLLRVSVAVPAHSWDESDLSMASVVVKEGESAEISCMLKESNVAYFWLKGASLENSTVVASFISGRPTNDPGEPFTVTENGTLIIKTVSPTDEGKYICRVSSKEISCHGEVFVFVQAALQDFQLKIEYCEPENSCVISTESTKPTSLTCKATNASPSMKLKWFNGSREIKDNIEENSLTKETPREISSTIKDVYKAPSTLTCQAVDFKTSNDDGMFAHVQFRSPASTADISPGWIVTAILFIVGFVILFLFVIFFTVWPKLRKGKDVETQKSAERESLLTNLQTKDDELKTKSEEINKLNKALMETKADKRVDETNVTSKDKELQDKREQISKLEASLETVTGQLLETKEEQQKTATTQQLNLESKLLTQKDSLHKKDLEIQKLQSNLEHVEKELKKIQNREQEISSKEGKLIERETKIKGREFEMNSKGSQLRDRETSVKRREFEMNSKEAKLRDRETSVKRRQDDMNFKGKMLTEWETNLKKREDKVNPKENRLATQEYEIKKQSLDLEEKSRKFRLDQMDLKDPIRINCRLITSRTGDDARVATEEIGGQAKVITRKKKLLGVTQKDATFHTIYPSTAKPEDLCQSIVDLVENAIDGRNSCLIAHGGIKREHWTTMFGPDEGTSDALVPYAITKICRRSNELRALGYKVDVTARFTFTSTPNTSSDSVETFDIANEQMAFELLKKGHGTIVQTDGAMDHFLQFHIKTEIDQETRTGTLVLGTSNNIQIIKECFLSLDPTIQLTRNISAIISDGRCRSVLITHIHEDRVDETKTCLAMVNEILKKPKK